MGPSTSDLRTERLELHEGTPEDEGTGDEEAGGMAAEEGLDELLELGFEETEEDVGVIEEESGGSELPLPPDARETSWGPGMVNLLKLSDQMSGHLNPKSE